MDNLTRTNAPAARRLFEAVEHRDREGVVAIYRENIVINEAQSLPYGGEFREHEGALRQGKASGQPGIVSSPRIRAVSSRVSSHRGTTWRCCGDTGLRTMRPASVSICLPPASIVS